MQHPPTEADLEQGKTSGIKKWMNDTMEQIDRYETTGWVMTTCSLTDGGIWKIERTF